MSATDIYIEQGSKSAFAVSLEWPGWCRHAKTADLAIEALDAYRTRYEVIIGEALPKGKLRIVGTVRGNATTDFGAPSAIGPWDDIPALKSERLRHVAILEQCWRYFDDVVDSAPARLVKGPRGGGRDRDAVVEHVREAERAYASRVGLRIAPRTPWTDQRTLLREHLSKGAADVTWPPKYALRRIASHVVDHAWEIEDKSS
jgi:hypothetical protein